VTNQHNPKKSKTR